MPDLLSIIFLSQGIRSICSSKTFLCMSAKKINIANENYIHSIFSCHIFFST